MRALQKIVSRIDEELLRLEADSDQEKQALEEARRRYLDMIDAIVQNKVETN